MAYWLVYKLNHGKKEYASGTDENGNVLHTTDKSKAYKFHNFNIAMECVKLGYCVEKEYC